MVLRKKVRMKVLLYYISYEIENEESGDLKCQIVDISSRQNILNFRRQILSTVPENIELVELKDGTKILDNEYLFALEEPTDLFIYPKTSSKYYENLFLLKRWLSDLRSMN